MYVFSQHFQFTVSLPLVCSTPLWVCALVLNGLCLVTKKSKYEDVMKEESEKDKQAIVSTLSETGTAMTQGERR